MDVQSCSRFVRSWVGYQQNLHKSNYMYCCFFINSNAFYYFKVLMLKLYILTFIPFSSTRPRYCLQNQILQLYLSYFNLSIIFYISFYYLYNIHYYHYIFITVFFYSTIYKNYTRSFAIPNLLSSWDLMMLSNLVLTPAIVLRLVYKMISSNVLTVDLRVIGQ